MKSEDCPKLDECYKIKMVLDKDLLDFQYAEVIRAVCAKCTEVKGAVMTEEKPRVVGEKTAMKLRTRVFELYNRRYTGLPELARTMEISVSQIYRVRQGRRPVSEKFITGAIKAFPSYNLDDLFYVTPDERKNDYR